MKKKLEAELISIAHRILKLKNRAELDQLQQETLKLYEKLSVLKFVEDNFGDVKPTIGYAMAEEKLEEIYNTPALEETKPVAEEEAIPTQDAKVADEVQPEPINEVSTEEAVAEAETTEEKKEEPIAEPEPQATEESVAVPQENEEEADINPVDEPVFKHDLALEKKETPSVPVKQKEISFEDFHNYVEPEFVKKDTDAPAPQEIKAAEDDWRNWEPKKAEPEMPVAPPQPAAPATETAKVSRSLNDTLGKSINIGLNDRIAFEKHLFDGSGEDLNRVLSQLNTFDKFNDARNFIEDLVKPDYNQWKGKEEYEERFMELVAKKFD
ncbi:hypothetical protein E0W68_13625 [Flavobacterium salilacus subsp. salilacus]|uniref:hypothetical protein n=1 Tax=Flavobacterium TaxID=237 RepID=UPI001075188B|nr:MULTISPECIES: hypothetical protein [Flavobacterium]KAF2514508.1 hypothetical protein E0W68_13625 [Flavobacterium salilacus subsp. salilacus]MBE1615937.1 hypothetical protein [Flavobacterium sp. SaA2.13]